MSGESKLELIRLAGMVIVLWWTMQPYNEPVLARFYNWVAKLCYWLARKTGTLGLTAEHRYYICAEAGI